MPYPGYDTTLGELLVGTKFQMFNYDSTYIKVATGDEQLVFSKGDYYGPFPIDNMGSGNHFPIVDLNTGRLSWMANNKPTRVIKV